MKNLSLNPSFSYFYLKDKSLVISNKDSDLHITDIYLASSIFNLKHAHLEESNFIMELSRLVGPSIAVRTFGQLKSAEIIISSEYSSPSPCIHVHKNHSYNYFEKILVFGLQEVNYSFQSKEILHLNLKNFDLCQKCIVSRLFSHRPLLGMSLGQISDHELAKPDSTNQFNDINISTKNNCLLVHNTETEYVCEHMIRPLNACNCYETTQPPKFKSIFEKEMQNKTIGFRAFDLEATFRNLKPFVSKYVGIIQRLEEYRESECDFIYNYNSGKNPLFSETITKAALTTFRSSSGGKGKSAIQSKVGALAEAIERYSMRFHHQQKPIYGSYNELKHKALSPKLCLGFSDRQYNAMNHDNLPRYRAVPRPITNSDVLPWFEVHGINTNQKKYVLADIAFSDFNYTDTAHAFADSNGCAAGNTYTEAVLQGTLELIERDAVAIWWYNRIKRQHIDLSSVNNKYIDRTKEYYSSINRSFTIIDITSDIGVPTFAAISYEKNTLNGIIYGFGCHVNPRIAIERATLEINQLLPLALKNEVVNDNEFFDWVKKQKITEHEFLDPKVKPISIDKFTDLSENNLESAINFISKSLRANDIELYALDITTQDTLVPCVKMIAPGMCHFWRRTGQKRLYDVPVKMGWLKQKHTESELNRHNITI
ncbi:YcaO-like family protein [Pseudoalteromonas viridis]|uniref:YcaO-like family protein n=1 Tax=Pseudoalteromonas viridis TaxID=339617 RepID=A0ABX7V9A6_9GAMM|nr:YcaO-like family protein [Pseudoalteromonas viridis]QTL37476.1 YcaO-like family protein [Pseudoalteromonas viridis]